MGLGLGKTVLGALPPIVGFVLGREGSQMFYVCHLTGVGRSSLIGHFFRQEPLMFRAEYQRF